MSSELPARKLPKHLIDPANPRPRQRPEDRQRDLEKLTRVKQKVSSALIFTTMFHLSVGLELAAIFMDSSRAGARIGLNVIAVILMLTGSIAARVINKLAPLSLWLLLALVPGAVGFYFTFR